MATFVINGSSGFIGKWLIKELLKGKNTVYALARKESFFKLREFIKNKNFNLVQTEYINGIILLSLKKIEEKSYFINLLWDGTSGSKRGDTEVQFSNLEKLKASINLAKNLNCKKFIGIGSIMEYEIFKNLLANESIKPSTIYGFTKIASRIYGKKILEDLDLNWNWITVTNSFGENENSERLINSIIKRVIKGEKEIHFDTNGLQLYDFIYIKNLVQSIINICIKGFVNKDYLVLGEKKIKNLKFFIDVIKKVLIENGHEINFTFSKNKGKKLDDSFTKNNIIFSSNKNFISFEEGIRRVYKQLKNEAN